jgi:TolB protein
MRVNILFQGKANLRYILGKSRVFMENNLLLVLKSRLVIIFFFSGLSAFSAGQETLGIFKQHGDIGNCNLEGNMSYQPDNQTYILEGSGENMWFGEDQFHFVWKKLSSDFIIRARIEFIGQGVNEHRKAGIMIRSSLGTDASHVNGVVHGDGLTSLQFRREKGAMTGEIKSWARAPEILQLERRGKDYILSTAHLGEPFDTVALAGLDLGKEIYAGLFICSHDNNVLEKARFSNTRIILPAGEKFIPYQDYLGSNLEILEMETGIRKVIYQSPKSLQAPNWSADGRYLVYNSEGLLYRFDLESGIPEVIPSGFATSNNNDHVISFDGKKLGLSHHAEEAGGRSIIYTMPVGGGIPERITDDGPSYLHGWSPDGEYVTYTGQRNGQFDIYKISVNDKVEIRLTDTPGLDDGSEYSPDGRYIYFNSNRTGRMKIWRMHPDGSDQRQITFDEYNDWFPHLSPDGRWMVFLSYRKEVKLDDHPFYKQVYLRSIPLGEFETSGVQPEVIAYVYGGQGTINVPSWSPDSKRIAFVSNSGMKQLDDIQKH